MTESEKKLEYLVVGTGRSGTLYAAKLLTALGIPCGHERTFNGNEQTNDSRTFQCAGTNSACAEHFGLEFEGQPIAESSYMAVPFLDDERLKDCAIIHVVRDPLKVIRSFLNNLFFFREERTNFRHPQEQFIYEHLPHLECLPDPVSRACFYYLRWNQMIEESIGDRKHLLYCIENGPEIVLNFLGRSSNHLTLPEETCNSYGKWPEHMRISTNLPRFSDEEIQECFLWKEIAALGSKYGYSHASKGSFQLDRSRIARQSVRFISPPTSQSGQPISYPLHPKLIQESFCNFNLIQYKDEYFALRQDVGSLDLTQLSANARDGLGKSGKLFVERSIFELRVLIRLHVNERRQEAMSLDLNQALLLAKQSLDAINAVTNEVVYLNEAVHRTEVRVANIRPWYREAAGFVRRCWQSIRDSIRGGYPEKQPFPVHGAEKNLVGNRS